LAQTTEVAKLKTVLSASVTAKKMAEEELAEFRSMQQSDQDDVDRDVNMLGLSLTSAQSVTDVREKVMRLEIENKILKKQLDATVAAPVAAADTSNMIDEATERHWRMKLSSFRQNSKRRMLQLQSSRLTRISWNPTRKNTFQVSRKVFGRVTGVQSKIDGKA